MKTIAKQGNVHDVHDLCTAIIRCIQINEECGNHTLEPYSKTIFWNHTLKPNILHITILWNHCGTILLNLTLEPYS